MKDALPANPCLCCGVQETGASSRGQGTDAQGVFSRGAYLPTLVEESRLNRHGDKLKAGLLRTVVPVSLKVVYECYVFKNVFS